VKRFPDASWIVLILACSIGVTMLIFSITILWEVVDHQFISELPPNALQFLIGVFGGALGIIGAYVGYSASQESNGANPDEQEPGPDVPAE